MILLSFTVEPLLIWEKKIRNTRDMSIQGNTKFGPGKMFTLSLYLLPLLKAPLYSRERDNSFQNMNYLTKIDVLHLWKFKI